MGAGYRSMMHRYFEYTVSDYNLSAQEGDIQINLQAVALSDSSIDILLAPYVLEHVLATARRSARFIEHLHQVDACTYKYHCVTAGHKLLRFPNFMPTTRKCFQLWLGSHRPIV